MDYTFSSSHLEHVRNVVGKATGIMLPDHKTEMVKGRLSRRLRTLGLSSFEDYIALVNDPTSGEMEQCINALTTNVTSFLREPGHFEFLKGPFMDAMRVRKHRSRQISVWSAACSTGEEPYSIAMSIIDSLPHEAAWDVQVQATDVDTNVLETAAKGIYPRESIKNLPPEMLRRWFRQGKGAQEGFVRINDEIREKVAFSSINLIREWEVTGGLDAIFCRNVIIYFDRQTQRRLFDRMANLLSPGGYLFIGHSESLNGISDRFRSLGNTTYELIS